MYSSVSADVAYKFTGQEFDEETGLHNFRARMYDAELGMFYAYDPAAQGFSPFGYAGNNPVIYIDKDGKMPFAVAAILIAAVIQGSTNAIMHAGEIHDAWDFGAYFIEGFSRGGIQATMYAMVIAGVPPPAGLIPGLGYGVAVGASISGTTAVAFGEDVKAAMFYGGLFSGLTFGINGMLLAQLNGLDLIWGTQLPATSNPSAITGQVPAPKTNTQIREMPRVKINPDEITAPKNGADDFLPELKTVRLVSKPEVPLESVHGNSLWSPKPTWGYKLFQNDGTFLKNGINSLENPLLRYPKWFMIDKYMVTYGPFPHRLSGYLWEYYQNSILKGPLNLNMH
jgi:RHS repeat-associated protein